MNFFNIDFVSINLLSVIIGIFIGSLLHWGRGLVIVCFYLLCLVFYYYFQLHPINNIFV